MGFRDLFRRSVPVARNEPRVEFLGEQDGVAERELKALLLEALKLFPSVRHAYLARVGFQPAGTPSVAICLAADRPNPQVVREISAQFKSVFAKDTFVDIIFLSGEQQSDVARVCSAFYSRMA